MGKKHRKKTSTARGKKKSSSIDIAVIGCFITGILLTILIYAETGVIGGIISPVLGGIIGIIKYIIPLGIIGISISLVKNDRDYLFSKICQYIVFLSCIATMMTIFQVSKGNLNISMEFSDVLERAYELGTKNIGGGTIGTVIAYPMIKLLGMFGSAVTATGIAIIMLVFTFGLKPAQFIIELLDILEERKEERNTELEAYRQERLARLRNQSKHELEQNPKRQNLPNKGKNKKHKNIDVYSMEEDRTLDIDEEQITINLNNKMSPSEEKLLAKENSRGDKFDFNIFHKKIEENGNDRPESLNPNELEENLFVQKTEEKEEKVKEVLQLEHNTIVSEDENYEVPPVELMKQGTQKVLKGAKKALADTATKLQKTLYSFGVSAKVENVSVGPAITRYELKPAEGVRVSKIAKLSDDIALNLAAESIRIEAPIPGKQAVRNRNS